MHTAEEVRTPPEGAQWMVVVSTKAPATAALRERREYIRPEKRKF